MIESSLGNIAADGIRGAVLATEPTLPPIKAAGYEYVVAANGLFIRAEDSRMEAMVPVGMTAVELHGLEPARPYARLRLPRINGDWLNAILLDASARMPEEAMYQFTHGAVNVRGNIDGGICWRCWSPRQDADGVRIYYYDIFSTVIDLHSHAGMPAFWSDTDDSDERGLRFYAVIGRLDTDAPKIRCRVGVYGHRWPVPATTIFESAGPFIDLEASDAQPA